MIMGFTKPIEHFNLQRKKVITMNTLYVGIDVSSKSNVVYLMLLLLLLTACVLVESTKRYIWETTVIKLSKTSHGHVSSLFRILSKKSSDS